MVSTLTPAHLDRRCGTRPPHRPLKTNIIHPIARPRVCAV
jgi:hypothetical protein